MSIGDHRAQLEDVNLLAALADALLAEKGLAGGISDNRYASDGNRNGKNDAYASRKNDPRLTSQSTFDVT